MYHLDQTYRADIFFLVLNTHPYTVLEVEKKFDPSSLFYFFIPKVCKVTQYPGQLCTCIEIAFLCIVEYAEAYLCTVFGFKKRINIFPTLYTLQHHRQR
jgi:hypothetical protein